MAKKYIDAEKLKADIGRLQRAAAITMEELQMDEPSERMRGELDAYDDILDFIDSLQQEQPAKRGYKDCNGCEYNRPIKDQIGWQFRGCFGGDYKGKPIAEIELCPLKVVQQEQPSEELEEAAEEEVIIERAKDLYPKLLPFATYICGYAFHDNDGVPKETIQKYLSIGAEWRDAQIPKLPDDVGEAADYYEKHRNPIADTEPEECRKNFIAGAEWQKAKMMEDAVVAYVNIYENVPGGSYVELVADISAAHFKKKEGVKILILRED